MHLCCCGQVRSGQVSGAVGLGSAGESAAAGTVLGTPAVAVAVVAAAAAAAAADDSPGSVSTAVPLPAAAAHSVKKNVYFDKLLE